MSRLHILILSKMSSSLIVAMQWRCPERAGRNERFSNHWHQDSTKYWQDLLFFFANGHLKTICKPTSHHLIDSYRMRVPCFVKHRLQCPHYDKLPASYLLATEFLWRLSPTTLGVPRLYFPKVLLSELRTPFTLRDTGASHQELHWEKRASQ